MNNKVLEQLKQEYNEAFKRMQDLGEIIANCEDIDTNHCGQDAENIKDWSDFKPTDRYRISVDIAADGDKAASCSVEEQPVVTYKDLLGMEVVGYGGSKMKCEGCPANHYGENCVKVELVGGDYLCLAEPQQEKTIISFDEKEGNVMDDIKEKVEDFLNYLEGIVKTEEQ